MSSSAPIGAQIIARIVQALIPPHPDGHPLEECFPNVGSLDAGFSGIVPIPSGTKVTPGMTYDGKAFGPPPPAPPPAPPPPRQFTGTQIKSAIHDLGLDAFFSQAVTAVQATKPIDAWYFNAITPNDFYAENNAKLGRISARAATLATAATPPVTFTLATVFDKAATE